LVYTPDCRTSGCQLCGLCDFKTLRPVLCRGEVLAEGTDAPDSSAPVPAPGEAVPVHYRVQYTRLGDSRFYSHLEVLQLLFRALRRAGVEVLHSRGHNPTPRVSFSDALPVGMESEAEYFDMALAAPLADPQGLADALSRELPPGMEARSVALAPAGSPAMFLAFYRVELEEPLSAMQEEAIRQFLAQEALVVVQTRKGGRREVDIRPLVQAIRAEGTNLFLELRSIPGRPGVSPRTVLAEVLGLSAEQVQYLLITKTQLTGLAAPAEP
jgi:radical SAM-linked protein